MRIVNNHFKIESVNKNDILICAIGFESRSKYLFELFSKKINKDNIFVIYFRDFGDDAVTKYIDNNRLNAGEIFVTKYNEIQSVCDQIISFIENRKSHNKVYIDYSSMPRTLYCKLPILLENHSVANAEFLYVVGQYPEDYSTYPSAGIESFSKIGNPSLRNSKRLHIIGVGYDKIRTEALLSILNPDSYAVCIAHYSKDMDMENNVININRHVIDQSVALVGFCTDDFSFMVAKLCEMANENLSLGDVVFVPDGPKPLIMAMSLIPSIVKKDGIVCVQIARNPLCYEPVEVKPMGTVISFSVCN